MSQKSDASILSNIHDPWYTKFHKNQMLQFSRIFMTPGTGNFTKIKRFNFLEFSLTRIHEISQKSNTSVFPYFQGIGYMKIYKNQMLQFSRIFMAPGTGNFTKIKHFSFLIFSRPRVHEISQKSDASIFSNFHDPGYRKFHKNQTLQFS